MSIVENESKMEYQCHVEIERSRDTNGQIERRYQDLK